MDTPPSRRLWIIAGTAGCALLLLGVCLGGSGVGVVWWAVNSPNKPASAKDKDATKDAADLIREFQEDRNAFEQHYDGKRITITGRVVGTNFSQKIDQPDAVVFVGPQNTPTS